MPVFDSRSFQDHEQVVFCADAASGLRAIIAIHSTALGPSAGGIRFWDYAAAHRYSPADVAFTRAEEDAVYDVLRLSRGMSYKNALAGLRLGGGKSVIIGDPGRDATPELMRAFGRYVDRLGGRYFAAEDVGTSPAMLAEAAQETRYVSGLVDGEFASGDPSPHTALGVFCGIEAAVRHRLGKDSMAGVHVAVQGLGHVGQHLCALLLDAGARLTVTDIRDSNIEAVRAKGDVRVAEPDAIHTTDCDVFSPCALGGGLNSATIPTLKAKVIAGAANNQLEREGVDDQALRQRHILYAPDYVINAGGIISIESEVYRERPTDQEREAKVRRIADTLTRIFETADTKPLPTGGIANEMAEGIIRKAAAGGSSKQAAE